MTRYLMSGVRMSGLPVSAYCGLSAKLSAEHGAGRAAAISSAFHAKSANAEDAKEKLARLSPDELNTLAMWKTPTDVTVAGHVLRYQDAAKEQPVGLTRDGAWADEGEVLTCGTLDFAWVHGSTAYVADLKKTPWASSGPDSLQLIAYGYAWAKKHNCTHFVTGIWLIEDGEWDWSEKVYSMVDFESLDLWERIYWAASNNEGSPSFGDHCSSCYGRLHCGEYTAPAALIGSWLTPATVGGAINDPEAMSEMLALIRRIEPLIEKVKETAKEAVKRGLKVVDPHTGEVLKSIQCKGRESLNQSRLFAAMPEATRFIERGNPYTMTRWVKPAKAKVTK